MREILLKTFLISGDRISKLACLLVLGILQTSLSCPASYADKQQSSPVVITDCTGKKGKLKVSDARAIKLTVEMAKESFTSDEPLSLTLTFLNTSDRTASIMLPQGADAKGLFTYEIVQSDCNKKWSAQQCSPRSYAADLRRMIDAGASCNYHESELGFQTGELPYSNFLPPGHYRLTATYDGQRTFYPQNKIPLCLKSNSVKFSIMAK